MSKLNKYTDLEAKLMSQRGAPKSVKDMKMKPVLRFAEQYLARRGFLDGFEGLAFALLGGYYEHVRHAKMWNDLRDR